MNILTIEIGWCGSPCNCTSASLIIFDRDNGNIIKRLWNSFYDTEDGIEDLKADIIKLCYEHKPKYNVESECPYDWKIEERII